MHSNRSLIDAADGGCGGDIGGVSSSSLTGKYGGGGILDMTCVLLTKCGLCALLRKPNAFFARTQMSRQMMIDIINAYQHDFEMLVEKELTRSGLVPSADGVNAMFTAWNTKLRSDVGNDIANWRAIDQPTRAREHAVALMAILEQVYARNKRILETL